MISNLRFRDIKMFKGIHEIDFKPITIFTGKNNTGKSTLISFVNGSLHQFGDFIGDVSPFFQSLYPLSDKTSGTSTKLKTAPFEEENEYFDSTYIEEYFLKDIVLDDIQVSFPSLKSDSPEKIDFLIENNPVISLDPFVRSEGNNEFYYQISIDFEKIFEIFNSVPSKTNWQEKTVSFLAPFIKKGFPPQLFKTTLINNSQELLVLETVEKYRISNFKILIYSSVYKHIVNTETNDFFSFYFTIIDNSIRNNITINQDFSNTFRNILSELLKNYLLFPLRIQSKNLRNLINISAYRGRFMNETKSEAFGILTDIVRNEGNLQRSELLASLHRKFSTVGENSNMVGSDYFGSTIAFMKRWINEFELGKEIEFKDKPIEHLIIKQDKETSRYPGDLGFGNQQLLPIILAFCNNPSGLFLIEEPESHLHPALQSKLADFFSDAINFRTTSQFIIETHSEYFIRKLQYLVAKHQFDAQKIALYYIHEKDHIPQGYKQIQKMDIRPDGLIKQEFGAGFFDESANLAIELLNLKKSN